MTNKTSVIHIRESTKDPNEVYIGRAGKGHPGTFGNPCIRGETCIICGLTHEKAGGTIDCFEVYARNRIKFDLVFKEAVKNLLGKKLVCFCSPNKCHGHVLAKLAVELNDLESTSPENTDPR